MGCHLMSFSLFTAWHKNQLGSLFGFNIGLNLIYEGLCRLE
jgi:hypothetical protein